MNDAERRVRVDLAACYRLVAHHGWDDRIFTHISARVPGEDTFLINRYGMFFGEVTASSLVKVDPQGRVAGGGDAPVNPAGFVIHGAIHEARPDVGCVVHLHTPDGCAASALAGGLQPVAQWSVIAMSSLAYHDYEGIADDLGERERLVRDLGDRHAMVLRNHGTLACGRTVAEAFNRAFYLERACSIQVRAAASVQPLSMPSAAAVDRAMAQARRSIPVVSELAWPGFLRLLDRTNPGYDA